MAAPTSAAHGAVQAVVDQQGQVGTVEQGLPSPFRPLWEQVVVVALMVALLVQFRRALSLVVLVVMALGAQAVELVVLLLSMELQELQELEQVVEEVVGPILREAMLPVVAMVQQALYGHKHQMASQQVQVVEVVVPLTAKMLAQLDLVALVVSMVVVVVELLMTLVLQVVSAAKASLSSATMFL